MNQKLVGLGLIGMVGLFAWGMVWGIEPIYQRGEGDFFAILSGSEAVPPQVTTAYGRITFWFTQDDTSVYYRLEVYGIDDVLMVHLRQGWPGRWGPALAWLFPDSPPPTPLRYPGRFSGVLAERFITDQELVGPFEGRSVTALREEMERGRTFVQVDTALRQIGELRGQVQSVWTENNGQTELEP